MFSSCYRLAVIAVSLTILASITTSAVFATPATEGKQTTSKKDSRRATSFYFHIGGDLGLNHLSSSVHEEAFYPLKPQMGLGGSLRLKVGFGNIVEFEYRPITSATSNLKYAREIKVPMKMTFKNILLAKFNVGFPLKRGIYPYYGIIQKATHTDEVGDGFTSGSGHIAGIEMMVVNKTASAGFYVERCGVEFDQFSLLNERLDGISVKSGFWRYGLACAIGFSL